MPVAQIWSVTLPRVWANYQDRFYDGTGGRHYYNT